jgi:glycosyltransferase involved in cell wall biosynthesis
MRAFDRFDVVTVTSNADRDAFGQEHSVFTVPNSFDMPDPPPTRNVQRNRLGFIGNLGFAPNRDGLQWFVNRVWPLVRHAVPNAELRIAGAGSETLVIPDGKGIVRLGWVPDIDEELASWNATVAPIRYGGGSSIKVAETIAKGCPVIATTAGVRGFELRDGCHASIADSPRALAEACIRHLRDPELGPRLAENAMKLFVERYAPPVVAKAVQQVVEACLGRAAEERPCSNSVAR